MIALKLPSHTISYNIHYVDDVYVGDAKINCNELIFAIVSFLDFFSAKMLEGDKQSINQLKLKPRKTNFH